MLAVEGRGVVEDTNKNQDQAWSPQVGSWIFLTREVLKRELVRGDAKSQSTIRYQPFTQILHGQITRTPTCPQPVVFEKLPKSSPESPEGTASEVDTKPPMSPTYHMAHVALLAEMDPEGNALDVETINTRAVAPVIFYDDGSHMIAPADPPEGTPSAVGQAGYSAPRLELVPDAVA